MQPDHPETGFSKYACEHELGTPKTDQFGFSYRGGNYRGQDLSLRSVYARVGDWTNIKEMTW